MYFSNKNPFKKFSGNQVLLSIIAFTLPALLFAGYFLSKKGNVLTVDLGQQYVDLLAYYQQNLLKHPLKLIYSFSSGLGGSMLGTDSYYLLSPFNLLLLLFPQTLLPQAILLVISTKVGAIGLSAFWAWRKKFALSDEYLLAASSAFALSGFVIANNLNLMWLDSLILLPWLVYAIDQLLAGKKSHLLIITFLTWLTNFYTGYMTLLFGFLYFLCQLAIIQEKRKSKFFAYLKASAIGSFLCGIVLWPTFIELLAGKTNADVKWTLNFQFPPYQLLAKLVNGAYSFHEMSDGMPNIFIGASFTLLAILFCLSREFSKREKLAKGFLLAFLLLSLSFTPLVLIWHLGQFPVWYPGRFSFVVSFYAINLALEAMDRQKKFNIKQKILAAVWSAIICLYLGFNPNKFNFVTKNGQIAAILFNLASLLFICFIYGYSRFGQHFFLALVAFDLALNLFFSLNAISYQENQNYSKFAKNVNAATNYLAKKDSGFYRTEKAFSRSDDDPFTGSYNGITTFNSISNHKTSNLLASLGYVHNSNSYANQGGTLFTDAFLGVKYYLEPNYSDDQVTAKARMPYDNLNHRADLDLYYPSQQLSQLSILQNQNALPLIFASQSTSSKITFVQNDPVANQEALWTGLGLNGRLFSQVSLPQVQLNNVTVNKSNTLTFSKKKDNKEASVTFTFKPSDQNSYYLQLPDAFNFDNASLTVNDIYYDFENRDDQIRLVNIAAKNQKTTIKVTFTLEKDSLDLTGLVFWRFDNQVFEQGIQQLQSPKLRLTQSGLTIKSQKFTTSKKLFVSTIPYSKNWLVFEHGRLVKTRLFAGAFLSFNLAKGSHQLTLLYLPTSLLVGLAISLLTLTFLLICKKLKNSVWSS